MFKKLLLIAAIGGSLTAANAQIRFDASIEPDYFTDVVKVPSSPLKMQVLFVGGHDKVQTTPTYGNPAGEATAKQWHDFIGFTPDESENSLGWISVNHEMVVQDDNIGDGGGMTVFQVRRDPNTDTLIIMNQTLEDGRSGKFFNVDFVNHTGETGMNCGGISSVVDGRIWTAEEWWRGSNNDIADRDKSDFVIGTGTENGQASPAGFPGFDGQKIMKYQNYNYMTEIDPRQAKAVRKQYNWGRQPFEGGTILPDNKTVFLGSDATPGFFTKFVADVAGDFTKGTTYVYKEDAPEKWIEIDNSDLDKMLNFDAEAVKVGATMFNRLEWVAYDMVGGNVYIAETGRDNPAGRWRDEHGNGATHAAHHIARAADQGTHPDSSAVLGLLRSRFGV
jgi:secreted PhoX family phosphatase